MKVTIQDNKTSVTVQPRDFKVTVSGARGPAGPSEWGGIDGDIEDQTDLYNDLQARVPYTGATADVNLGEYGAQLGNLEFDNTPTNVPTAAGSVYWNDTDGTLNMVLKGGQTISRIGETQHIRVLNNTGTQIARGKVVYIVGAQGQRLTIALADADTEILSKDTIGFTSESIAAGAQGFVIVQGVINNISTNGMTDGATVYLSQTAGSYTTTPPADPAHQVILGFIVNGGSGGAGSIYVKVDNGYELEELHNVSNSAKTTPVGDDALLLRDSADSNLWKRLTWTNALAGVKTHMDTFKSVSGGYASLDGSGKVPSNELPSYVDDVVEVANYAALPVTGETGKIYVTLDTNKCYRWSGSVYVQVAQGVDTLTTTGTSGAATLVGSTLNIPQYQGVLTNPVTGTGTAGQVAYFSGTSAVTGSANLFWDAVNGRLGVGTSTPLAKFHVFGTNELLKFGDGTSGNNAFITFNDRGFIGFNASAGLNFITNTTRPVVFGAGSNFTTYTEYARFATATGNLLLNTTIDAGQRLQVIGSTLLRGSTTTSATTALLVQNSAATELFKVTDNGVTTLTPTALTGSEATSALDISQTWNTTGIPSLIKANVINTASSAQSLLINLQVSGQQRFAIRATDGTIFIGGGVSWRNNSSTASATSGLTLSGFDFTINNGQTGDPRNYTSGTGGALSTSIGYVTTSGTGTFTGLTYSGTINQTGGANGITRGLYVNPTLTAAADWRSIEWSNNTGWGLYGAGTAPNYLAGSLGIGTTNITSRKISIGGTTSGSGFNYGITASPVIQSDGTNYIGFNSEPTTQATTFTLTTLRHFSAIQGTFGLNSTVTSQYGFWAHSTMIGATNNYGFYGDIASGTGRWNLYMNGTAANYLAGNTSIGTTTSSGRLTVRGETTTSASNGLLVEDSAGTDTFTVRNDGGYAFKGGTVGVAQTGYTTFTNLVTDRTCNANATTVEELADILGTLIEDLKTKGIIAA